MGPPTRDVLLGAGVSCASPTKPFGALRRVFAAPDDVAEVAEVAERMVLRAYPGQAVYGSATHGRRADMIAAVLKATADDLEAGHLHGG
ncbi:hypothetical protein ACWEO4_44365 [Streptomyces sp. NPDC004393]